jgi:hypothetical protein
VRKLCDCGVIDGFEYAPGGILKCWVAGYTVEDEDGLDGFGATSIISYANRLNSEGVTTYRNKNRGSAIFEKPG